MTTATPMTMRPNGGGMGMNVTITQHTSPITATTIIVEIIGSIVQSFLQCESYDGTYIDLPIPKIRSMRPGGGGTPST